MAQSSAIRYINCLASYLLLLSLSKITSIFVFPFLPLRKHLVYCMISVCLVSLLQRMMRPSLVKLKGSPSPRAMVTQKARMLRPMKHPRRATNLHQATNKRNAPFVVTLIIRRSDSLQRKAHPRQPKRR